MCTNEQVADELRKMESFIKKEADEKAKEIHLKVRILLFRYVYCVWKLTSRPTRNTR